MICAKCGHSSTDHLTGKCVNRRMWHEPARGTVIEVCGCKRFEAPQTPAQARRAVELAPEPARAEEPEPEPKTTPEVVPEPDPVMEEPKHEEPKHEEPKHEEPKPGGTNHPKKGGR